MPHLEVRQINARLFGFDDSMREPREYEAPLCAEVGGDHWFPEPRYDGEVALRNAAYAKKICFACDHRIECAEWGIANERFGIWGGISSGERKAIRSARGITLREDRSA